MVYRTLTVVLMLLVAIATVQLIAPGAGYHWFGSGFTPSGVDVRGAVHLPVDRADPRAGVHRRRRALLVARPQDPR